MSYVYEISFDIPANQMDQLKMGKSLQRVIGYLKALLPGVQGFQTARGMYSLDRPDTTHIVFHSVWEDAHIMQEHQNSRLAEEKVIAEFDPYVERKSITVRVYDEVL